MNQREVIGEKVFAPQNVGGEHILGDGGEVEAESVQRVLHFVRMSEGQTVLPTSLAEIASAGGKGYALQYRFLRAAYFFLQVQLDAEQDFPAHGFDFLQRVSLGNDSVA